MTARWLKRNHDGSGEHDIDPVDDRLRQQARRAGRTLDDEQERILHEVLPGVRRTAAEAGLTLDAYLRLDREAYDELLATHVPPTRSLFARRSQLLDYDSYARLRRWLEAAASRAGEDVTQCADRLIVGPSSSSLRRRLDR